MPAGTRGPACTTATRRSTWLQAGRLRRKDLVCEVVCSSAGKQMRIFVVEFHSTQDAWRIFRFGSTCAHHGSEEIAAWVSILEHARPASKFDRAKGTRREVGWVVCKWLVVLVVKVEFKVWLHVLQAGVGGERYLTGQGLAPRAGRGGVGPAAEPITGKYVTGMTRVPTAEPRAWPDVVLTASQSLIRMGKLFHNTLLLGPPHYAQKTTLAQRKGPCGTLSSVPPADQRGRCGRAVGTCRAHTKDGPSAITMTRS